MAKGYWIVHVDVNDTDSYKNYVASNHIAFSKYGGRFLVRGGSFECVSGKSRSRNVVIEFPSFADAKSCWISPEYQTAKAKQNNGAIIDCVVIEGYDEAQPS